MSIQNIDQLTGRIGVATDKLEVAVVAVRESAGVVVGGTGESAQSAIEAANSAVVANQAAQAANVSREAARVEANRAATQASLANSSATSSAVSESNALAAQQAVTNQVDVAGAKANQATQQATIATQQAEAARQSAIDAANVTPSTTGMVEEAPRDNQLYGRVDGTWGLVPTGSTSSGTGAVDSVNGIAPDAGGNVTVPIPQPASQVRSDWNAAAGIAVILNKPSLFSGSYNDLTNKPSATTSFSGDYNDLTNAPEIPIVTPQVNPDWYAVSGKAEILNKPALFDGRYESLTGKPPAPTGDGSTTSVTNNNQLTNGAGYITDSPVSTSWYARKGGAWAEIETGVAFSGDYRDLTNQPVLNTDGTIGNDGSGFNGDYNDLVNKPPLITSNTQIFNGAGYLEDAIADNKQYIRKNGSWVVFESNAGKGHQIAEAGQRLLYMSHTYTEDPALQFNYWTHPNPHIPYPLYFLGHLSPYMDWVTDGALITPEYFSYLPSGRYSFGQGSFESGHLLAEQTGYIEVVEVTSQQQIPTMANNAGFTKWSTGVVHVIDNDDKIISIYDFNPATGDFILRAGGDNSGVTAFSGRYIDLAGKPVLFSGNYNDLASKPSLFSGDYNDLVNTPAYATSFSGDYTDLTSKPSLFSGDYTDLINKPTPATSFSGDYTDLINKPNIPILPTKLSQFTNDIEDTFVASKTENKRTGIAFEEWIGTQAQYDAITTKDANTRYWITEA